MRAFSSRRRGFIDSAGERVVLIIRRLKSDECGRVHHELPDILVPYKRYSSESIEAIIAGTSALSVAADESTISRIRAWFSGLADYFTGALLSIAARYTQSAAVKMPALPESPLQVIWHHVGDGPGWLARVVRSVVNANLWLKTRSAFLSA